MSQCPPKTCDSCAVRNTASLQRHGINIANHDYLVALAGNPNTGKSTVFNQLTGLRQHTGNWPGKTVTRAEGGFSYDSKKYKLVDLPGTYSLLSTSHDEEIARDFILFGQPDVTVIVVDATALERNLNLALQILQMTSRAVLALNLMDEAKAHGISVDARGLAKDLGIPVASLSARSGKGIDHLLKEIDAVARGEFQCKPTSIPYQNFGYAEEIEKMARSLRESFPGLQHAEWIAMRLIDGDARIEEALRKNELVNLVAS